MSSSASAIAGTRLAAPKAEKTTCKFCPDAGIVPSDTSPAIAELDRAILQPLLSVLAPALLFFGAASLAVSWQAISPFPASALIALLAVLAVCSTALFSGIELTPLRIRLLELTVFGSGALFVAVHTYARVSATGEGSVFLIGSLQTMLLLAIYGLFVPNNWRRAILVAGAIAALPLAVGALLRFRADLPSDLALGASWPLVLLAGGAAVGGSHFIGAYRRKAFEARETNLYHLKRKIGVGGMGEVWLAEHKLLARRSAIKMIHPQKEEGSSAGDLERLRGRFEREARVTASLRSPHTVELYDFGVTHEGTFFYVMEYLEGFDMDSMVKRFGPLPAERVVHLLLQACDSLGDAHENGLVHRDIKPANLYVTRMGLARDFVKVLDFGLVKRRDPDLEGNLTVDGVTTGTPAFMAPEMAKSSREVDHRADLYALGCVGYWLLTGHLVFDSENPLAVVVDHVNTEPVPPSKRSELPIPAELERIILKCLEKDPGDRYQNACDLAEALAGVELESRWDHRRAADWWNLHQPRSASRLAS